MCPDDRTRDTHENPDRRAVDDGDRRRVSLADGFGTLPNALVGGTAGLVLSFVPLSTVLGGAVAGYLDAGPGRSDDAVQTGLLAGGLAGVVGFLPVLLLGYLAFSLVVPLSGFPFAAPLYLLFMLGAAYFVGLSAVGGVLGVIVYHKRHAQR